MGELIRLDAEEGDLTWSWDPDKPEEVALAEAEFNRLRDSGNYLIYTIHEERTDTFVPDAGKMRIELTTAPAPAVATSPLPDTARRRPRRIKGKSGEVVGSFQPAARQIVAQPRMRGG